MKKEVLAERFKNLKTKFPTQFADISNGETIGYREAGEGPKTLLILHGGWSYSATMEGIVKKISLEGVRCVAPD